MGIFTRTTNYTVIDCYACGFSFGLPRSFNVQKKSDGSTFYCPSCGKPQCYTVSDKDLLAEQVKEAERLREQLACEQRLKSAARDRAEQAQHEAEYQSRRAASYKGHLGRVKKRVTNGVCPCCDRHFKNLERHMKGQHPEYVADAQGSAE